jgi:hypothetical protein
MRTRVLLKSPVRENCTPGSVRGLSGNWQSYRDLPLMRIGFWSALGAFLIGWFATDKSRVFLLISSLLIWILWTAATMGV